MTADHNFDADSLDRVERELAIDAFLERIAADESLSPQRREQLIREIHARMDSDDFWEDDGWDDGTVAALVRKLGPKGPKGPKGKPGAAVRPEAESQIVPDEPKPSVNRFDLGG
jgi:hypothetical protein